jgi:hypothetical protein
MVYQEGLALFSSLSDEAAQELLTAIEQSPASVSASRMISRVAATVKLTGKEGVENTINALFALHQARSSSSFGLDAFVADVVNSVPQFRKAALDQQARILDRLKRAFSVQSLITAEKAYRLQRQHSSVFVSATAVTDIRPVFAPEPAKPLLGAMLIHTLKITCIEGGEFTDRFFAMDDNDIATLQEVLARVEAKTKNLRLELARFAVPDLET